MPSLRDEITRTFHRLSRRGTSAGKIGPQSSRTLAAGAELGPYRVLKQLGSGGMGQVYLALDTHLQRKVALKILPVELSAHATVLRRFEQEARTASALNHPNILTILAFPEISGRHILVSEFVEGQTLRKAIEGKLEIRFVLDAAVQVASALAAAHAAGVVHRDLKPTNIMIRPDGYVKVIDFGLAKLTQRVAEEENAAESWTLPGAVVGTVGYMSPEQARGEEVDARSDVWSLGVILYEMLAHNRPFEGTTDSHVIVAILDAPPPPIPDGEELPPGLVEIIHRALAKNKKERYESARELLADLEQVRQAMGGAIHRPNIATVRRRTPYFAVAGILAIFVAGFAVWWWPLGGHGKLLGPRWFEIGGTRRLTFAGNVTLATISPDGKHLAYASGSNGKEHLRLLDLQTNSERQLPAISDHYLGLTFAPDSKTLFYVLKNLQHERGHLFSIPVNGFGLAPPALILEDLEGPLTFSPGGDRFAFVRGRAENGQDLNEVLLGSASNPRHIVPLVSLHGTQVGERLAWSPHDQWLGAITYPSRLNESTKPNIYLYGLNGRLMRMFGPANFRRLYDPIALDGGSLLIFAGKPQGGDQNRMAQLSVATGQVHQLASSVVGFDSLSATADSNSIAAIQFDERSSIWIAESGDLSSARKLTPDSEKITSLSWLAGDTLVFPSARSGNVNLVQLKMDGTISPVAKGQSCMEDEPATVPSSDVVIYASNCAHLGDDFNLWSIDKTGRVQRQLTGGSNFDYQPNVSADGKWAYYTSWSSNIPSIWRIEATGGTPTRVLKEQALTPIVSPDGSKLVGTVREADHGRWTVAILSTSDGRIIQLLPKLPIQQPIRWSPDGQALDYVSEDETSWGIWRQPLPAGPAQVLVRVSEGTIPSFAWNQSGTRLAYLRARDQKDAILFTRANKN